MTTITDRIDGVSTSLAVKAPCQAVSNTNLTLEGEQTVNGVAVTEGDRVLVKDQDDATENGIYVVGTGAWTRAPDFDGNRDVVQGTLVLVFNAIAQGVIYQVTTADPIVIGTSEIEFALDDDPSITYPQTADEVSAGVTPVNTDYPAGHLYRYGNNTTPGTTNMTTAAQNAHLSSLQVYWPNASVLITGSIPLRDYQRVVLDGTRISITGNTQVFTVAAGIDDWAISGDWSVTGDNGAAGATSGTGAAAKIVDSMRWRLDGLTAKNIRGWGILIQPGSSTSSRAEHGQITRFQAAACYVGLEAEDGTGAEYVQVVAPIITRCNTGMIVAAGNLNVIGGSITDNKDGVKIENGSNHAHGSFVGTHINHNTDYDVRTDGVTFGHNFVGCHIYQGDIWLKDSNGIIFRNCTIDAEVYYFDGSDGCGFIECTMPSSYTNTITNDFDTSPSYTIWRNCKTLNGEPFGENYKGIRVRAALSSPVNIAAATLAAETTVLLEDTAVSVALPDIRRDLGLSLSALEWVVNVYTVALAALLLAGIGVHGVLSYAVAQRTREIGVRVALGAETGRVLALVMGDGARLVGLGLALGLVGALALSRVLDSLLFGVTTQDPATFLGVTAVLVVVALLASWLPARRASHVDPVIALKVD